MIYHFVLGVLFLVVLVTSNVYVPSFNRIAPSYETLEPTSSAFASLGILSVQKSAPKIFNEIQLEAKSVYVLDLNSGEALFSKDAGSPRPLASLTKLFTAFLSAERIPEGVYIPVSLAAIQQEGDSGFLAGDKFRKDEFLDFMLIGSSNDAAYASAQFVGEGLGGLEGNEVSRFSLLMNERAGELGFSSFSFLNPHGLDIKVGEDFISGANGSAEEIALLMKYIFENRPGLIKGTANGTFSILSENGREVRTGNTNAALSDIPQLLGAKTGFTDIAGGNLVFIFDAGFSRPVVVSILGSSQEGRFEDARRIVEAVFKYYQSL